MNFKIINNYKISAFKSKSLFLDEIVDTKKILVAMNAEKIMKDDYQLQRIVNENIAYTDGFGAVIALRSRGLEAIKIPGSEFWLDIVARFEKTKKFYLIGSTTEVIEATVNKLKEEYSHIEIVGYRNGFFVEGDKIKLLRDLKKTKPDIVFVAQGSPKQEFLMDELISEYKALYMGLGGSFDIYGGNKKRAPLIFLKLELEWLYRLIQEPTRFSRQLALIKFFTFICRDNVRFKNEKKVKHPL
ncbi:MAG: Probable UDP-N-acetyl-D-mannosaminuronic acid transferase (EC [uncultured Sulfurovum sp.]|uniref:Probable UDP-N-acetyl-D-mannosaminuronic acid transferase (EC) n=1 Tax=uncultured Sulfurovum sp. TaxID=269237 RepID=A0A6S6SRI7_9BACT|nr:MAG: Probable UDP-N-acetyl-D-mannosaminuronic acid transferase (EC [uncultured Sulfurovum sp.]